MNLKDSMDERALMDRAHYLEIAGKSAEALEIIKSILETNPDNAEAGRAFARLSYAPQRQQPAELRALALAEPKPELAPKPKRKPKPEPDAVSPEMQRLLDQNAQMINMLEKQQRQQSRPRPLPKPRPQPQPTVNITNQQVSTQPRYAPESAAQQPQGRNETARMVGCIPALLGIFGISHLLNGKIGEGLLFLLIFTPIYWIIGGLIYGTITAGTLGLGLLCTIPIHLLVASSVSNAGANR